MDDSIIKALNAQHLECIKDQFRSDALCGFHQNSGKAQEVFNIHQYRCGDTQAKLETAKFNRNTQTLDGGLILFHFHAIAPAAAEMNFLLNDLPVGLCLRC